MRRKRNRVPGFLWGSFWLVAIIIFTAKLGNWNEPLGAFQAQLLVQIANMMGLGFAFLTPASLVIPDPTGWSILQIEIECTTLIEASVFTGLLLFYPRFTAKERISRLGLGLVATLLINLMRLAVIAGMVHTLGKSAVPLAHAVVGRVVFFAGVVVVYWRMLTMPTLRIVNSDLRISGRVDL
jgi:exosortase family protein XrtG